MFEGTFDGRDGSDGEHDGSSPGPCRILLLEDHDDTRRLLGVVLRKAGHSVTEAGSVAEARAAMTAAAAAAPFDVLIADLQLPDGRAEPLIRAFKDRYPRGIAIVTSAHAFPSDVRDARAHGADLFLAKPFTLRKLQDAVSQLADCPPGGDATPDANA